MTNLGRDVVIIGGGITGISVAYYLSLSGIRTLVIEKDSLGSHASGSAYGSLAAYSGSAVPKHVQSICTEAKRVHEQLADVLPRETKINYHYRIRPTLSVAFTQEEADSAKKSLALHKDDQDYSAEWINRAEALSIEPRLAPSIVGGLHVENEADLEPYKFVQAMSKAAKQLGAEVKQGHVTGLQTNASRVTGVYLKNYTISCGQVVIATGPWAYETSQWLGLDLGIRPLKGQILRLQDPSPPINCILNSGGNYVTSKPDGLLWAGTTEENAGFDCSTTQKAKYEIQTNLYKMLPSLAGSPIIHQSACLRPMSADGIPLVGNLPGLEGVLIATGGGRKGILLGPVMGKGIVDILTNDPSPVDLSAFDPKRLSIH